VVEGLTASLVVVVVETAVPSVLMKCFKLVTKEQSLVQHLPLIDWSVDTTYFNFKKLIFMNKFRE
jgi:hypothetical protein